MSKELTYYYSFIRKGLGNGIIEEDDLDALKRGETTVLERPEVKVVSEYKVRNADIGSEKKEQAATITQEKIIKFVGPGDVLSINPDAVMKIHPDPGSNGFPITYSPYIEFWEADFPWRYSPAAPKGVNLRPWLALIVCKETDIDIHTPESGLSYISFVGSEEDYRNVFLSPSRIHECAHAQGKTKEGAEFSRIISIRNDSCCLEQDSQYVAMLVPTFETGRLRGLGILDTADIPAQMPAWEESIELQRTNHGNRQFDFPIYYKWSFNTGGESFEQLVNKLSPLSNSKAGISVDVTNMGEGLDYESIGAKDARKSILMPTATKTLFEKDPVPFPSKNSKEEKALYKNLKDLLEQSPVFRENKSDIEGGDERIAEGADDPMVVPPVYGARHAMTTGFGEKNQEWVDQVNLDIHFRIAAGLGKKIIQNHQEELMNRAWKQVESVKALNNELHKRLLSINANKSLRDKTIGKWGGNEKFIANMMAYLGTMKNAKGGDVSLNSILASKDIPRGFASASFQQNTREISAHIYGLDSKAMMENIVKNQTYKFGDYSIPSAKSLSSIETEVESFKSSIYKYAIERFFKDEFMIDEKGIDDPSIVGFKPLIAYDGNGKPSKNQNPQTFPRYIFRDYVRKKIYENYYKDDEYQNYEITRRFFNEKRLTIKGTGKARRNGVYTSLVFMWEDLYEAVFGRNAKPFTRLGGEKGVWYMNYNEVRRKHQDRAIYPAGVFDAEYYHGTVIYDPFHQRGVFTFSIPDSLTPRKEIKTESTIIYGQNIQINREEYDDGFNKGRLCSLNSNNPRYEEFKKYQDWAIDYVYMPTSISVDMDDIPPKMIQEIDTLNAYWKRLTSDIDLSVHVPLLKSYLELKQVVSSLRKVYPAEPQTPKQEESTSSIEKDAETLKKSLENEEAYERMRSVASKYYEMFFSDSSLGEKLRNNYLDELLSSRYPIIAYPQFPEPTYHYLKLLGKEFILPSIKELKEDTVSLFLSNAAFEESFLSGMNTEMGKELLWREYPTDQRGSYFRKFWDSDTDEETMKRGRYFDIKAMHAWSGELGSNHMDSKCGLLIFALKGKLMRLYPDTSLYLAKAAASKGLLVFDEKATVANNGIIHPSMQSFIEDDILLVGFDTTLKNVLGDPGNGDYGYMLTFAESVNDLNFVNTQSIVNPEDPNNIKASSSAVACSMVNRPTIVGKHISLFLNK